VPPRSPLSGVYATIFQECLKKKHGTVLITAKGQEVDVVSAPDCDGDDKDYINKFSIRKLFVPASDLLCTSNMRAVRQGDQSHESSNEAINLSSSAIGSTFCWRPYFFIYAVYRETACTIGDSL